MPQRGDDTRMALDEVAGGLFRFCFIGATMVFLLAACICLLSVPGPGERVALAITLWLSSALAVLSMVALRRSARARRKAHPAGIEEWMDRQDAVKGGHVPLSESPSRPSGRARYVFPEGKLPAHPAKPGDTI